ncbi:Gfo/Idh/MocA family oxidoreductase [Tumebacillus sp. DT12]|uniref:Gfo/Idh/MocA family oxidoreductase n=1 Tax=Tumebacillus lacus TaxID=2995335 RepID=A0ABT3X3N0_9BACL|nr:Gfo/Idh/MocA family oxidoreductase [Tumebacillus lacus]MCX7570231.1 Gfo/Idh/MocA family oxidoreductase [Tumebacillus lacus]
MIRLAIIGAGWISQTAHLPLLTQREGVTVVAVCDTQLELAQRVAAQFAIPAATDDITELFELSLGGVIVATPTNTHAQVVEACLDRGLHVMCEKPLGLSEHDLSRLREHPHRERLAVGYVNRHREDVTALRDLPLGDIRRCTVVWRRQQGVPRPGSWITQRELSGGGVLLDLGSHMLDLGLMFCPLEVQSVEAVLNDGAGSASSGASWFDADWTAGRVDVEQAAVATIHGADGREIRLHVSWDDSPQDDRTQVLLEGSHGRAELRTLFGFSSRRHWEYPQILHTAQDGTVTERLPYGPCVPEPLQAFAALHDAFLRCIENGEPHPCGLEQGLRVAVATDAIYKAGAIKR